MNDQERKDEAKLLKRTGKNYNDDDHGRYTMGWAQRYGDRSKKGKTLY
nr:hypothetical protein [Candidatus Sigynarchaeota archaeon]